MAQTVKNLPATWETLVPSLGQEDPLEKGMATHSSIIAWRIPWTEEPGDLRSMGSQRVRHDWLTLPLWKHWRNNILQTQTPTVKRICKSFGKVGLDMSAKARVRPCVKCRTWTVEEMKSLYRQRNSILNARWWNHIASFMCFYQTLWGQDHTHLAKQDILSAYHGDKHDRYIINIY